jgi:hypothetical protein
LGKFRLDIAKYVGHPSILNVCPVFLYFHDLKCRFIVDLGLNCGTEEMDQSLKRKYPDNNNNDGQ